MARKTKPQSECTECESLREIVKHALGLAAKRLDEGNISGVLEAIENAHKMAKLFLTEDHGDECNYKSLKDTSKETEA